MQAQTIQLFPIGGRQAKANLIYGDYTAPKERQNPMNLQLAESTESPLVKVGDLEKNRYYRPKSNSFPAVGSLLLVHPPNEPSPILLVFQITWNRKEHNVDEDGLRKTDDLQLPLDTRRYYVEVTPEGIHPKITVSVKYF